MPVEVLTHDGLHRFALAHIHQLADLTVAAAVHPDCGDATGEPVPGLRRARGPDAARRGCSSRLRAQAQHLEGGGTAPDSPLAGLVSHGVMRAAKGGGAAGGSSLLD